MKIPYEVERYLVPNEKLLRVAMRQMLQYSSGIVVEELKVAGGTARIDFAVVGDSLYGIELKSDGDSLNRLPRQMRFYNMVFDHMLIVTGFSHLYDVLQMVPTWWAISVAELMDDNKVSIIKIREGKENQAIDPSAVVNLLKRREVLEILDDLQISKGWRSKRNSLIYEFLVSSVDDATLAQLVKQALIARTFATAGQPLM